jgi:hypothetical protein
MLPPVPADAAMGYVVITNVAAIVWLAWTFANV